MSNHAHYIRTRTVKVKDGTHPPSDESKSEAAHDKRNAGSYKPLRPHHTGYKHAIGRTRYVERQEWYCSCGKTANGCTFSSEGSAKAAGLAHANQSRKHKAA
jgi:hypothetical protein